VRGSNAVWGDHIRAITAETGASVTSRLTNVRTAA